MMQIVRRNNSFLGKEDDHIKKLLRENPGKKFYFGIAKVLNDRAYEHFNNGRQNYTMYCILKTSSDEEAVEYEKKLIERYKKIKLCINKTPGGEGCVNSKCYYVYILIEK